MARGAKAKKDPNAFPYRQLTVLAICRFAEPIAFNSIMAYSFAMVNDLNGTDKDASFYSGLLVSGYAVAETITAMGWGVLSDKYGRKPVVICGLIGVALSCLILGFAKNFWIAFAARFVGGALNGNVSVMQTMVAEIVKLPEHEPAAYATQPFVWTLGGLIGSAIGGYLAQPANYYPDVFPRGSLFDTFPYLLPNLASFVIISISIIQGIFLLEETNPNLINQDDEEEEEEEEGEESETSPLNPNKGKTIERTDSSESTPLISDSNAFGTMSRSSNNEVASSASSQTIAAEHAPYEGKIYSKSIIMIVIALFIMSYHQMAFVSLIPIHVIDKPSVPKGQLDFFGGFGMSLHAVSNFLLAEGVSTMIFQAFVFPTFLRKVGVWRTFVVVACLYPTAYILMPFLWAIPKFLIAGVYISLLMQVFYGMTLNASLLILLKNACPDPRALGRVMGLGMSVCCLARTISPPLVGLVYDTAGSAVAWFSCAVIAALGIIEMLFVPRGELKKASADDEVVVAGH